ncbi:MAG TPA: nitroreductase family protein [Bacteroidota bacterium]|nr:nitroreductase family protein [Bacteroidota bacterium]
MSRPSDVKANTKVQAGLFTRPLSVIYLPKPKFASGKFVVQALQRRRTIREISEKKISLQVLSNLLWAAYGINRKQGPFGVPGRTAASASNSQEIDLYVILQEGSFLFDALHHSLFPVCEGDLRSLAIGRGQADPASRAPVHLVYVVDIDRLANTAGYQEPGLQDSEIQKSYYFVDTGMIAGNVYLYSASCGLAAWFHNCERSELASNLHIRAEQRVLFAQTVGYPAKKNG